MNAPDLLRSVGFDPDGPAHWERPIRSRSPGVYLVELPEPTDHAPVDTGILRRWIERVPSLMLDGNRPTPHELAARLGSFWLPGESVVYVGTSSTSLGGRVAALYQTPLGDRRPHAAGHWLKTLSVLDRLRIWWAETDAAEEYEDALLSAFAASVTPEARARLGDASVVLPFANLVTATGERKEHGITGSLLAATDAPATATASARKPARRASRAAPPAPGSAAGGATRTRVKPASRPGPAPTYLSPERLEAIRDELRDLTEVRRPEIVTRIKAARELGDLRENADYEAARNEQSFNEGRIQALENLLRNAIELQEQETEAGGEVRVGSTVAVESAGHKDTYRVVAPSEASPGNGRISYLSPLGQALMGKRVGDDVDVRAPSGNVVYRIVEVS